MHASLLFPNEFLCAADLRDKDVTLTISRLSREELKTDKGDEPKWILYFQEMEERHRRDKSTLNKRLVLNKTNAKSIAKVCGSETDDWSGKRITLYATTCKAFGEIVDCIRIREKAPPPAKSQQKPDVPDQASGP